MRALLRPQRAARLGLAALILAIELGAVIAPTTYAQSQAVAPGAPNASSTVNPVICLGSVGPPDYPIAGGWFYTQEACAWGPITGHGPSRARGYMVVDDAKGNFWTEFRRYGGVDVLGYPVSQPYQYPVSSHTGYWYQAFERGILQYQPEAGQAVMANVFEQFTEAKLDDKLEYLGIPKPDAITDSELRMGWLVEPRFFARYFFDPVAFHSSEPQRPGQTAFVTQEQARDFFGLPEASSQRMTLLATDPKDPTKSIPLAPLMHSFIAQRLQKGGMQLFVEDIAPPPPPEESFNPATAGGGAWLFDPTIVPGDAVNGCVALTAVGLLGRTVGIDKIIPYAAAQPQPFDPSQTAFFYPFIPPTVAGARTIDFQLDGTTFGSNEPVVIVLSDGMASQLVNGSTTILRNKTINVPSTNPDGSFQQVITVVPVGTYTVTATGTTSGRSFSSTVDLTLPTLKQTQNRSTCTAVGLPVGN
jgi:hypothetical protein